MLKRPFVIDLFDGKFFGGWMGEETETERGTQPHIRPMSTNPLIRRTKPFNYEIDPNKNVGTYDTGFGLTFKILIPTEDVPDCDMEETLLGYVLQKIGRLRSNNHDRVKELKREKRRKERELERLREPEHEQSKFQSNSSSEPVDCPNCGENYSYQKWTSQDDGECPSCGNKHPKYSDE